MHKPNKDHLKFGIEVSWQKADEDKTQNRDYQIISALKDEIWNQPTRGDKDEDEEEESFNSDDERKQSA